MGIHLIYTISQYISVASQTGFSPTQKFIAMVFTTLYSTALGLRFSWSLDSAPMALMNGLITFEDKLFRGWALKFH